MSYELEQVVQGAVNYVEKEVMAKLPTSKKWIVGTALGLASLQASKITEYPIVKALGIIDDDNKVNVNELLTAMKGSVDRYGKIVLEVPLVGKMSFSADDIDKLGEYIS